MKIGIPGFNDLAVGFEPLPVNTYDAKCTGCEPKKGKEKGTPYIGWEFEVTGPTHAGRKIWENTGYGDVKTQPFTKRIVVGCGAEFTDEGFSTEDCLGKLVKLTLGQRPDNQGKLRNSIDKIEAA